MVQSWVHQYGMERVVEVLEKAEEQRRNGKIRNMVGWIRTALRKEYTWGDPTTKQRNSYYTEYQEKTIQDRLAREQSYIRGKYADFIDH